MVKKSFALSLLFCLFFVRIAFANSGPAITNNPVNSGVVTNVFSPVQINIFVADVDNIDPTSIIFKINNEVADYTFIFDKIYVEDSCGGYYTNEIDYTKGTILGPTMKVLKNGTFMINVQIKDGLGNLAEKTFTFQIAVPPRVTGVSPRNGEVIHASNTVLTFTVDAQMSHGLDSDQSVLLVDEQDVPVSVTSTGLTAQLTNLASGVHTVSLLVSDTDGVHGQFNSTFINTYGEMLIDAIACGSCHSLDSTNRMVHSQPTGNCNHCHVAEEYKNNACDYCHSGQLISVDRTQYAWDGTPYVHNEEMGWVWDEVPSVYGADCRHCHTVKGNELIGWERFFQTPHASTTPVAADYPYAPAPTSPYPYVHRIYPIHDSDFGAGLCANCHSSNLTSAHNNRITNAGTLFDCASCHSNTDERVIAAIAAQDKTCEACHSNADHESLHISTLDSNCTTNCHEKSLTLDHMTRLDDSGNNYTCDTCHNKESKFAKRAVANNNLNCAGCHENGHGVILVDASPADIPPVPGFKWTTPMEASLFSGDPGTPDGYEDGQVLISNRRLDVTVEQIWQFYSTELVAKDWVLQTGTYIPGDVSFVAEYEKGGRFVTIMCYNTRNGNGLGEPENGGYRIQIWYK